MHPDFVERHSVAVPRYTSYPTAPHFSPAINGADYAQWLGAIASGTRLSLYVHIPFCDRLCWFCGCNTKQTRRYDPLAAYLKSLHIEIARVGAALPGTVEVAALHLGGGSPTMLKPDDIAALDDGLRRHFRFAGDCEISVEMDPNDMTEDRFDAFAAIGMTRASLGVQDFNPVVQRAINREQTFEQTRAVVDAVRARGVRSVNLDVLYGLPHQTRDSVERTVRQCLSLNPDRIALFGYAHVPWMKKHQTMIDEAALPGPVERFAQMNRASNVITAAGYQAIGIDHFARPRDSLAVAARSGHLRRNFQGYTDDTAPVLIGLGASSIGKLPQGYVQNTPTSGDYQRRIGASELAVVRGYTLSDDDTMRAAVIEKLMCEFGFDKAWLATRFGDRAGIIVDEANYLAASDSEGMFARDGDSYHVTDRGRPFVRIVASAFDAYFGDNGARHSAAV